MYWVMGLLPFALLLLGFPIFLLLLITSLVILVGFFDMPMAVIHQNMFNSLNKYALLAVPFLIFAGELMIRGAISKRIVDWVLSLFGGVRGSLGMTTIGTIKCAARLISDRRADRDMRGIRLITTQAASAANTRETMVRNSRLGQKLALNMPSHTLCVSSQAPGVSCQERMPLIQNRLPQAATEYSTSSVIEARSVSRSW